MPTLTINGKSVDVPPNTNLIEAARAAGVHVPHFCYHPDLPIAGNCRMCLVAIEKMPKLQIACNTIATDGMVVTTNNDVVQDGVQGVLEFLLKNHPIDCPICDQAGECKLQDYYMDHGLYESRVSPADKVRKGKVIDLGEMIMLDRERCVLCSRCVRFGQIVTGKQEFEFRQRGDRVEIFTFGDRPLDFGYAGNYADMCPVGALTSKDFRFKKRVWLLDATPSVCPHCSTGCNIQIDHQDRHIYRLLPRRNPDVNQSWMCDIGRLAYKVVNAEDRLTVPMRRMDMPDGARLMPTSLAESLALVADGLRAARESGRAIALVASPRATNETLYAFRALAETLGTPHLDYRADGTHLLTEEREDQVLRRRDPHPNNKGAAAIIGEPQAPGMDVEEILNAAAGGQIGALYLLGTELLTGRADLERVRAALANVPLVAVHAQNWHDALEWATVVFPAASYAEQDGTFTNYTGRVQRIMRAFPPPGDAKPAGAVVREVIRRAGGTAPPETAAATFKLLAETIPAFDGITWQSLAPANLTGPALSAIISLEGARQTTTPKGRQESMEAPLEGATA
jgi:NADH-quinone oxidoreductase subunit G